MSADVISLTLSVYDVTALESAVSGIAMESGSTPGAVRACINSFEANQCWKVWWFRLGSVSSASLLPSSLQGPVGCVGMPDLKWIPCVWELC